MSHPAGCISQAIENATLALLSIARADETVSAIRGNAQPSAADRDVISAAFTTARAKVVVMHTCLHRAYSLINDPKFQLKAFHSYNETSGKVTSVISRIDYVLELLKREYIILEGEIPLVLKHVKSDLKNAKGLLQTQLKAIKNTNLKVREVTGPIEVFTAYAESAWTLLESANKRIALYFDEVVNKDELLEGYARQLEMVRTHLHAADEALASIEDELKNGNYPITSDKVRELRNIIKTALVTSTGLIDWPERSSLSEMQLKMIGELHAGVSVIYSYGTELILKTVKEKICSTKN